jgi:hypothetical protein
VEWYKAFYTQSKVITDNQLKKYSKGLK